MRTSYDHPASVCGVSIVAMMLTAYSPPASAQAIPTWVAIAAVSPIIVIALSVALAWLERSVRIAMVHIALLISWIAMFSVASYYVPNDYVIWTPLVLYLVHAGYLLVVVAKRVLARTTT